MAEKPDQPPAVGEPVMVDRAEQARLMARRRVNNLLLTLPILAMGIEKCVSEGYSKETPSAPPRNSEQTQMNPPEIVKRDYSDKFLGSWEMDETHEQTFSIKKWEVSLGKGPAKRVTAKNGASMNLIQTVKVDSKDLIETKTDKSSVTFKKGYGGIYKLDKGGYALATWNSGRSGIYKIEIKGGDLHITCVASENSGCTKDGVIADEIYWGSLKRKK